MGRIMSRRKAGIHLLMNASGHIFFRLISIARFIANSVQSIPHHPCFIRCWYQITVIIPPLIKQRAPPKKPLPGRPSPLVFGARTCLVLCYSSSTGNATKGIPVSSEELSASPPAGPYTAISDVQPSKALGDMSQSRDTRICVSPVQFLKA